MPQTFSTIDKSREFGMHWRWWRICRINILWFKKLQSNFNGKLRC
jgi:hypothetical protein